MRWETRISAALISLTIALIAVRGYNRIQADGPLPAASIADPMEPSLVSAAESIAQEPTILRAAPDEGRAAPHIRLPLTFRATDRHPLRDGDALRLLSPIPDLTRGAAIPESPSLR